MILFGVRKKYFLKHLLFFLETLEHRAQVNNIFWAPCGQYVVFGGLKT